MNAAGAFPRPFDATRASRTLESLAAEGYVPRDADRKLLESAFGNSGFLCRLAVREHALLREFFDRGPEAIVGEAQAMALNVEKSSDQLTAMTGLRQAKRRAALSIALADIAGQWSLEQVTRSLTEFADACVKGALRYLLSDTARKSGHAECDGTRMESNSGLIVLAMGKYGAYELNYSSDIDLIVFYEADLFPFQKKGDQRAAAVDLVRGLVRLISETNAEGYVFRVDLRLRPDAGATQVAVSTEAAEIYYEGMGQNWERAAMIKARPCAGDPEAGARFMKSINPFVWRRSLDFAAIEDIHSIKRQIHAHGGHASVAVAGHNIKLGRGGIREIEFFVQTQQLILGGRDPALRSPRTLEALDALRARGLVTGAAASELKEAYRYLRMLEHRLQMIEDEQTHIVPKTAEGIAHIACFTGYPDSASFSAALTRQLETVESHYARLFEAAPELTDMAGNLVFTGVEDDPETLKTLAAMGFVEPHHVAAAIRGWHHGRVRATRSARARELLTKLMPALLKALSETADPDMAFAQFDRFLSNLPSGVQLFSLFLAQGELLRLIAEIAGSAPRLATHLARAPATLDALLDIGFLGELPSFPALVSALRNRLEGETSYEGRLDAARRFVKEQIFRVGVQVITGAAKADEAGPAFANIAEATIGSLVPMVENEMASSTGRVPGGAFAVVAMGKLGGREMTAASDLDLVFVYEVPKGIETSDGLKSVSPLVYYARFAQRLIGALTAQTAAGGLYEVDMRLRPSGNKGPVAVSLESFARYHEGSESWTWERLALTRARVIVGPDKLKAHVEKVVAAALSGAGKTDKILADARDMRAKLEGQFPGRNRWDLKFTPGGLIDIEFIAQTMQLLHPKAHDTNTLAALEKLKAAGVLNPADAAELARAAKLQHALTQVLRIALEETMVPETATKGLKALLVRAGESTDFNSLDMELTARQETVRGIFNRVLKV